MSRTKAPSSESPLSFPVSQHPEQASKVWKKKKKTAVNLRRLRKEPDGFKTKG